MGTVITIIILIICVALVILKLVRDKKAGKKSCGCDFSSCGACSKCNSATKK